jgi:hypothetical protein
MQLRELIERQNWQAQNANDGSHHFDPMDSSGNIWWNAKLYRPIEDDEFLILQEIIGLKIAENLESFFRTYNGLSLHLGMLSIFGIVKNFTRDPDSRMYLPISIAQENEIFQYSSPDLYSRGFRPIGGVSVVRQDRIIAEPDSVYWVNFGDSRSRNFDSLDDLLVTAEKIILNYYLGKNQFSASYEEIDLHLRSSMNALN